MSRGKVVDFKLMYDVPDIDPITGECISKLSEDAQDFWNRLSTLPDSVKEGLYIMWKYGLGKTRDDKGHQGQINLKLQPKYVDMVSSVVSSYPEGWFGKEEGLSKMYRSLLGFASYLSLAITDRGKKKFRWMGIIQAENLLEKEIRETVYLEKLKNFEIEISKVTNKKTGKKLNKILSEIQKLQEQYTEDEDD